MYQVSYEKASKPTNVEEFDTEAEAIERYEELYNSGEWDYVEAIKVLRKSNG